MCQIYDALWQWVIVAAVVVACSGAFYRQVHARRWSYEPAAGCAMPRADARAAANRRFAIVYAATSVFLAAATLFLVGGGLECMNSPGDIRVMPK